MTTLTPEEIIFVLVHQTPLVKAMKPYLVPGEAEIESGFPVNASPPVISGPGLVGQVHTCSPGTWINSPTLTYQWRRNNVAIAGATSSTYATVTADNGTLLTCAVTGTTVVGVSTVVSNSLAITTPPFLGYDIFVVTGDSNNGYGQFFNSALDQGDPQIFQYGNTAPNVNVVILAAYPMDTPYDNGAIANLIGHEVHFIKDFYMANGLLPVSGKALVVGYWKGGTTVSSSGNLSWAMIGGPAGAPVTSGGDIGNMIDVETTRINAIMPSFAGNAVKAVLHQDGPNAYYGTGNVLAISGMNSFRWRIYRLFQYFRNFLGPTVPIMISRLTDYLIDAGHVNFSYNGLIMDGILRGMPASFPYMGLADTQDPTILHGDAGGVHYTSAEQRLLAGRFFTAYNDAQNNLNGVVTWTSADAPLSAWGYPSGFTFSNGDLDVSGDANNTWKTVKATAPLRSGKAYVEVKVQAMAGNEIGYVGLCNADKSPSTQLTFVAGDDGPAKMSAAINWNGSVTVLGYTLNGGPAGTALGLNDVIMFAVDMATGRCWIGKNGTWLNSGNPSAGTGWCFSGIVDPTFIACSISGNVGGTNTWRLQPTLGSFTYTPPAGFPPWASGGSAAPSVLSYSPVPGSTGVAIAAALQATFSEAVTLGASGVISLKRYGDNVVLDSWDVATAGGSTAGKVEVVGGTVLTMHPTVPLTNNVQCYVTWTAGVVKNAALVGALPLSAKTVWSFWTVPATVTPTAGPQQFMASTRYDNASGSRQYMSGFEYFVQP